MGIRTTVREFKVKAFNMGEFLLPFPIKISDIDAMEDEEKMRRLGRSSFRAEE
jgi:hypothetical protein